jgi:L-alanine-DL-glutamate epimerase-like enolase superfamily enzyme
VLRVPASITSAVTPVIASPPAERVEDGELLLGDRPGWGVEPPR